MPPIFTPPKSQRSKFVQVKATDAKGVSEHSDRKSPGVVLTIYGILAAQQTRIHNFASPNGQPQLNWCDKAKDVRKTHQHQTLQIMDLDDLAMI